jgi:hypothetical protein
MSYYDYRMSSKIDSSKQTFYSLIMAAMRRADSQNVELMKRAWPEVWEELEQRYHAPGGILPGEDPAMYEACLPGSLTIKKG